MDRPLAPAGDAFQRRRGGDRRPDILHHRVQPDHHVEGCPVVRGGNMSSIEPLERRRLLAAARDRNKSPNQLTDTLIHTQLYGTRTWEAAVPNGRYEVHLIGGDPSYFGSVIKFDAEGVLVASGNQTSTLPFIDGAAVVTVA